MSRTKMALLYRRFRVMVLRVCRRILVDDAAAEDATQTAFLLMQERMSWIRDEQESAAWLRRTARNVCLNELRARSIRPTVTSTVEMDEFHAPDDFSVVDRHALEALEHHLPEVLTVPAWLYYGHGIEQGEIAELLGVSRRTVIARLQKFIAASRAFLDSRERPRGRLLPPAPAQTSDFLVDT
ncbi:MAG TPA: sigma-70 family RNA polymerase sigma factor [Polyangia bacterium]